ncbi:MAG: putative LPS assembly protein LptD [Candidatus Neomarinimicrobiota bacterium]
MSNDRLRLKRANLLESKTINNRSVKLISGNVIFTKGNLTLNCQEGRHYEKDELAILYRNVTAFQEGRTLVCDTLKFFSKEDKLLSIGNPHVWDKDYDLKSDSLTIFTKNDSGIALGNVTLIQKGQTINADKIEYIKDTNSNGVSYIASGNVIIKDSSRTANCGKATYNRKEEITILEIEPQIFDRDQILSGSKIILKYKDEDLKELNISKNAQAITTIEGYKNIKNDSLNFVDTLKFKNNIQGSKMTSFFDNGQLKLIQVEGMAKTLYHVFEDSIYVGKNNSSGDTIIMNFSDNSLKQININGGSKGEYIPDSLSNDVGSKINYSSDFIKYKLDSEETDLRGNTQIKYEETDLEAGFITVNWRTNILNAKPMAVGDSSTNPIYPTINEKGRDPMTGDLMIYNLKTKKGRITKGSTKADDGFYAGNQIRNESEKVIFIENSTYTTCDLDTAHFHFKSSKMKIIQNDIVIAKPIILHIAQIPILGIPLGIFPHKGGKRHSGWIMPSYGDSKNRGQYIQGLGFYWAPNDYWDSKLTTGFGDKQGFTFKIKTLYKVRYKYSGSINFFNRQYLSGSNNITTLNDNKNTSTTLKWTHKQDLRKNQSLNANITISTNGNYNKNYGITETERMDQKAISNISYSKRWPKAKNSFNLNFYSNKDLLINDKINPESRFYVIPKKAGSQLYIENRTFPKFSFRHGQSDLFPTSASKKNWYNNINWNYSLSFNSQDRDYYESYQQIDSTQFYWDGSKKLNKQDNVILHTSRINAPQKLFKYITINPSVNLKSAWVNKFKEGRWIDSTKTFDEIDKEGFAFRTTGSFSLNSNTQIYGIIPIPFGPLSIIRHVISPSIGYSWTPDFSQPLFGRDLNYFSEATDVEGQNYYFDKFKGSMAGSTPKLERKSMNFGINNVFQAKIKKDTLDKKVELFNWKINSSYNFAGDSLKISNLRSSIRSKIANKLTLDFSMTHDFYQFNSQTNRRIDQLLKDKNGLVKPRLVNARFSTGFKFSGNQWANDNKNFDSEIDSTLLDSLDQFELSNLRPNKNQPMKQQLWRTNISLAYSLLATNPENTTKDFWMNTTSSIKITKKWRASYRARFDLIERELVNHSISINRDLHCWELSLNWTPTGYGQGINFKLNVKSPTLQDIKVEKKGGVYSGAGI